MKKICDPFISVALAILLSRRELVPGTIEVFPIKDYGAIQLGSHRFYIRNKGEAEQLDGIFRFVHVWKNENGRWKIARVVSFDH